MGRLGTSWKIWKNVKRLTTLEELVNGKLSDDDNLRELVRVRWWEVACEGFVGRRRGRWVTQETLV